MQDPNERRVIREEVVQTPEGADATVVENRMRVMPTPAEHQVASLVRAKQIVWFIIGLIIALIALRFVLLALGANPANGFARFVYGLSRLFDAPFLGIFGAEPAIEGSYFEFASLIAIAVYLLLGWIINRVLELVMAPKLPPTY
jgi:YggT family protein